MTIHLLHASTLPIKRGVTYLTPMNFDTALLVSAAVCESPPPSRFGQSHKFLFFICCINMIASAHHRTLSTPTRSTNEYTMPMCPPPPSPPKYSPDELVGFEGAYATSRPSGVDIGEYLCIGSIGSRDDMPRSLMWLKPRPSKFPPPKDLSTDTFGLSKFPSPRDLSSYTVGRSMLPLPRISRRLSFSRVA